MSFIDDFEEVRKWNFDLLNEVVREDTEAILKEVKEIRDKAFNKEYDALRKLEAEVEW
jgi:hypothetical protein